jgi:hypothetical protein
LIKAHTNWQAQITSQFLPVCSAQYMGSKLTKFKFWVCSWTNFDICLISFYFISIYCYDCLNTNLLIHFFFYSGSMSLCVDTRSATEKVMGERWDLTKHVYPLINPFVCLYQFLITFFSSFFCVFIYCIFFIKCWLDNYLS